MEIIKLLEEAKALIKKGISNNERLDTYDFESGPGYATYNKFTAKENPNFAKVQEILLEIDKKDTEGRGHYLRGQWHEQLEHQSSGTVNCTENSYSKAYASQEDNTEYLKKLAFAMYRNESYTKAIKMINKLVKLDKQNPLFYFLRGNIHTNKAKWDKALKEYDKAIKLDTKDERFYRYRAQCYSYSGQSNLEKIDLEQVDLLLKEKHNYNSFASSEMADRLEKNISLEKNRKELDEGFIYHLEGVKNWWYNLSEHIIEVN